MIKFDQPAVAAPEKDIELKPEQKKKSDAKKDKKDKKEEKKQQAEYVPKERVAFEELPNKIKKRIEKRK